MNDRRIILPISISDKVGVVCKWDIHDTIRKAMKRGPVGLDFDVDLRSSTPLDFPFLIFDARQLVETDSEVDSPRNFFFFSNMMAARRNMTGNEEEIPHRDVILLYGEKIKDLVPPRCLNIIRQQFFITISSSRAFKRFIRARAEESWERYREQQRQYEALKIKESPYLREKLPARHKPEER